MIGGANQTCSQAAAQRSHAPRVCDFFQTNGTEACADSIVIFSLVIMQDRVLLSLLFTKEGQRQYVVPTQCSPTLNTTKLTATPSSNEENVACVTSESSGSGRFHASVPSAGNDKEQLQAAPDPISFSTKRVWIQNACRQVPTSDPIHQCLCWQPCSGPMLIYHAGPSYPALVPNSLTHRAPSRTFRVFLWVV